MNIVTIDFDIIMKPDINLYNGMLENDLVIDDFIKEHELLKNLKADLYIYEYITRYLTKVIKRIDAKNVYFIKDHDTIVKYLNDNERFNLWNIDHHHDITYDDENVTLPIINCHCGDWVKYLMDRKKIKYYTWISNNNSYEPGEEVRENYKYNQLLLEESNLDKLALETDKLFICLSPPWVPDYYTPLYQAWIAICEEYYEEPFKVI